MRHLSEEEIEDFAMRRECSASALAHLFDCPQCFEQLDFELNLIASLQGAPPALWGPAASLITDVARLAWPVELPIQNGARLPHCNWAALPIHGGVKYGRRGLDNNTGPFLTERTLRTANPSVAVERRQDERFPTHSGVIISNLKQSSEMRSGTLRDISRQGILINTRERPTVHDAFEVRMLDAIFLGEAAHVRVEGRAWLVGIRLRKTLTERELRNAIQPFAC
jgi:hypothetical protein